MGFKKYPKIYNLGSDENIDILKYGDDLICVEEKVDGGNGSFWLDIKEQKVHTGSRNRDLTSENDEKTFSKQRIELSPYVDIKKINPDYVYYIEWMQKHTISYRADTPSFIGLDIRPKHAANQEGFGLFLGREAKEHEFKRLGIECIPIIWKGKASELKKLDINKVITK